METPYGSLMSTESYDVVVDDMRIFVACVTYESGVGTFVDDFPPPGPMWILGKEFTGRRDQQVVKEFIQSRLWVTYRKGFSPIGGTGPTGDTGWGCMLRCGQMMLAQALICRHLGPDWKWNRNEQSDTYTRLLKLFLDKKDSPYSIHQIAQMGVSEGKEVSQWYGPNTVAQVLRKLAAFDHWSNVAIHVALDNTVVKDDIRKLCRVATPESRTSSSQRTAAAASRSADVFHRDQRGDAGARSSTPGWRPLVLFIPLRLGLNEINAVYIHRLTQSFRLKQSLGVIGGKPNHAHYFIGVLENTRDSRKELNLVFLDPHTTQPVVDVDQWNHLPDESYHCSQVSQMPITSLDPSIALGFYCHTEADFDDWCANIQQVILDGEYSPMFEVTEDRPVHWPPFTDRSQETDSFEIFTDIDYPTDDDFEVVNMSGIPSHPPATGRPS